MTDIEQKALALVNEVAAEKGGETFAWWDGWRAYSAETEALCRAIEQHEAFRQEVSKIIEDWWYQETPPLPFRRFIIAKPDPLVEALLETFPRANGAEGMAADLRAAIEARGGRIVWGEG